MSAIAHSSGLFVVGTDTNVGKTFVAACMARRLHAAGLRVGVYKPAASGCRVESTRVVSTDALELWEAAGRPRELADVCPQRFVAPLAPHLAALAEGRVIDARLLREGVLAWRADSDFVIVEGAGGLLSPVGEQEYVADVARDLGYPLLIVAPNVLGVINQTLQTLLTARHWKGGLPVAGIVLNHVRPLDPSVDPSVLSNADQLRRHAAAPLLAVLEFQATDFTPPVDWPAIARSAVHSGSR